MLNDNSDKPQFSIILSVYNDVKHIKCAILSILNQDYKDYEIIIIDGGSNDGTVDIISLFRDKLAYFTSEKDKGISDAWNKALKKCNGKYIAILNSDDFWKSNYLYSINEQVNNIGIKRFVLYGKTQMIENNKETKLIDKRYYEALTGFLGFRFMHTSIIAPTTVYNEIGGFNLNVRIAIDTEWMMRARIKKIPFIRGRHTNHMRLGGISDKYEFKAFCEFIENGKRLNFLKLNQNVYILFKRLLMWTTKN